MFQEHEKKCEFLLVDCPFRSFGCGSTVPSNSLEKHIQNECEYRPRQCGRCHVQIPMAKMEVSCGQGLVVVLIKIPNTDMAWEKVLYYLRSAIPVLLNGIQLTAVLPGCP